MECTVPAEKLRETLCSQTEPIGKRMRALFYLRTMMTDYAVESIGEALKQKGDSALLRHELAYVLGQMQNSKALETLTNILEDDSDDTMVRHECAEALGAIGDESVLSLLLEYSKDPCIEISETCQIASDLIKWKTANKKSDSFGAESNPYNTFDPAPCALENLSLTELKKNLLDTKIPLFERYQIMFSLRNIGGPEAALILTEGFNDKSDLFRHEIAYVLGQMMEPVTAPSLIKVLKNEEEHRMVRHEAAEALGAIGTIEAEEILENFKIDKSDVVAESCVVALDVIDYWQEE